MAKDPIKATLEQEQLWKKSGVAYFKDLLRIQTKKSALAPYERNDVQKVVVRIKNDIRNSGRLLRLIILKARQFGISTNELMEMFRECAMNPLRNAIIVTHEPKATKYLFRVLKRAWDNIPFPEWRPQKKASNATELIFDGIDSTIMVGTAGSDNVGSGTMIHRALLCMTPDTPVIMEHGRQKCIKNIATGEKLITHDGNIATVVAIGEKKAQDMPSFSKTVKVTSWVGGCIEMSPEHKVFTDHGWLLAGDLQSGLHKVGMPVRKISDTINSLELDTGLRHRPQGPGSGLGRRGPDRFPLNKETGFFVGYYLAEGCLTSKTKNGYARIVFAFGPGELHYATRAVRAVQAWCPDPRSRKSKKSKTETMDVNSVVLGNMLDKYFGAKDAKHIPDWAFQCGRDFLDGVLIGYLSGDGSKKPVGKYGANAICASSIRESLTYQIRDIACALGYGWGRVSEREGGILYGRNCQKQWTVFFNGESALKLRKAMGLSYKEKTIQTDRTTKARYDASGKYIWIPIKRIERGHSDTFFDICVDHEDHSFRTAHFSVSNSELAKWPAHTAESVLISLNQTIPKLPGTQQVIESTAFGMGGKFHELYWAARFRYTVFLGPDGKPDFRCDINPDSKKENEYSCVFIPCFVFMEYRMDPEPGFRRTPYEEQICLAHGVGDDFLAWRRHTIANECLGSEEKFKQEYPLTDLEAFLASGRPVFDPIAQVEFRRKACRPAAACYKLEAGNWVAVQPLNGDTDGLLQVWEEFQPSKFYVVPGDVAEGLEHGDFDSADVLDQKTGKQVAHWHGHTSPDQFGKILAAIGHRYGDAWVAPERNNHGHATIAELVNSGYENVTPELSIRIGEPAKKHFGFFTGSSKTGGKTAITDEFAAWFRVNPDLVNCKETCGEMLSFKNNPDGTVGREAASGHFDDRVISFSIGNFIRTRLGPAPRYRDVRPSGDTPSPNSWT